MQLEVFGHPEGGHHCTSDHKHHMHVKTVFIEFDDLLSSAVIERFVIVVHFVYVRANVSDLFVTDPTNNANLT